MQPWDRAADSKQSLDVHKHGYSSTSHLVRLHLVAIVSCGLAYVYCVDSSS